MNNTRSDDLVPQDAFVYLSSLSGSSMEDVIEIQVPWLNSVAATCEKGQLFIFISQHWNGLLFWMSELGLLSCQKIEVASQHETFLYLQSWHKEDPGL